MTAIYECPECGWRVVLNPVSLGPDEPPRIDCYKDHTRMSVVD